MRTRHRSRLVIGTAAGLLAAVVVAPAALASPSAVPVNTAKVDCVVFDETLNRCTTPGVVYAMTEVGDRTIIGGAFTSVSGVPRANIAAVLPDGSLDLSWDPSVDGTVYALATSSDNSRVFLGGGFTAVGGQSRGRLAAVDAVSGAPLPSWTTAVSNNLVRALATDSQDRLYVGGTFGRIGGKAISRLAAVSQNTGALDTSFTPGSNGGVRALALSDDQTRLYAGGSFTSMGGTARRGIAELTSEGVVTDFAPTDGGVVIAIDVSSAGRLFAGTTTNRTWAYDPGVDNLPRYRVRTGGDVQAILATDTEVYIGGHFETLPEFKLNRNALASFAPATGTPTAWDPGAAGSFGVWALTMSRPQTDRYSLSIGGDFTRVAGLPRRGYTRFDF